MPSGGVRAEQCQIEPWPRYERDVGSIFLAPAELETVAGFLDRNRFPPCPPLAVIFGQHDMVDIDLIPIFGEGSKRKWGFYAAFRRIKPPNLMIFSHFPREGGWGDGLK